MSENASPRKHQIFLMVDLGGLQKQMGIDMLPVGKERRRWIAGKRTLMQPDGVVQWDKELLD